MQSILAQVRATFRYIVSGVLLIVGALLWLGSQDPAVLVSVQALDRTLLTLGVIVVAFLIGHPASRLSTLILVRTIDRIRRRFRKKDNIDPVVSFLQSHLPLRSNESVSDFMRREFGATALTGNELNRVLYWCKQHVWHSGSPLWAFLNEREQLISMARDTWNPFLVSLVGFGCFLASTGSLSFGVIVALVAAASLTTYQAIYRQLVTYPHEVRDVILSYLIVKGHELPKPMSEAQVFPANDASLSLEVDARLKNQI